MPTVRLFKRRQGAGGLRRHPGFCSGPSATTISCHFDACRHDYLLVNHDSELYLSLPLRFPSLVSVRVLQRDGLDWLKSSSQIKRHSVGNRLYHRPETGFLCLS